MSCIKNELIQKYIDKECSKEEILSVKKHLENCKDCRKILENKSKVSNIIKQLIQSSSKDEFIIPDFNPLIAQKPRKNRKIKTLAYSASTACLLLIVFLSSFKNQKKTFS